MGQVTSLFVRKMIAGAGETVDANALLQSVGLDPDASVDPKAMVDADAYYDLLERIAIQTDVTALPVKTGALMRLDDYGALGLAFKAAVDLKSSYARVARFARLWTNVVEYELEEACRGDGAMWFNLHRTGARRLGLRLSNEATLASGTAIAREVSWTGTFTPLEVHLRHSAPRSVAAHERFFGCPVIFNSERDALLISREALERPNRLGDEGLTRFITQHLEAELQNALREDSVRDQTKQIIARALSEGLPRMEEVARRMGMSARSLHRRLADHGVSFHALADETRHELAIGLLREEHHTLSEVAFLVGFSEQSAFTRAFKRWTGVTPAAFRENLS